MSNIDLNETKSWSADQLLSSIAEYEGELLKLRFDHASRGVDNPLNIRTLRRDIARLKTILRQKELESVDPSMRSRIRKRRRLK